MCLRRTAIGLLVFVKVVWLTVVHPMLLFVVWPLGESALLMWCLGSSRAAEYRCRDAGFAGCWNRKEVCGDGWACSRASATPLCVRA